MPLSGLGGEGRSTVGAKDNLGGPEPIVTSGTADVTGLIPAGSQRRCGDAMMPASSAPHRRATPGASAWAMTAPDGDKAGADWNPHGGRMSAPKGFHNQAARTISTALVPPKAKELLIAAPIRKPARAVFGT